MSALLFGFDDVDGFVDAEDLPVGSVVGLIAAISAVAVPRSTAGDVSARRRKGAWCAAGVSLVPVLLLAPFGPPAALAIVLVAAIGWVGAWVSLPRLVDLDVSVLAARAPARRSAEHSHSRAISARGCRCDRLEQLPRRGSPDGP